MLAVNRAYACDEFTLMGAGDDGCIAHALRDHCIQRRESDAQRVGAEEGEGEAGGKRARVVTARVVTTRMVR